MDTATLAGTTEDYLWQSCLAHLEAKLTKPIFDSWIKPMRFVRLTTEEITLSVPSAFAKEWAENRLKGSILGTLTDIIGSSIAIKFIVDPDAAPVDQRP